MTKEEKLLPELLKYYNIETGKYNEEIAIMEQEIATMMEKISVIRAGYGFEDLEEEIKTLVLEEGISSKTGKTLFIYKKGSSKWDSKKLTAYAKDHPHIMKFKTTGKPSVSVKKG